MWIRRAHVQTKRNLLNAAFHADTLLPLGLELAELVDDPAMATFWTSFSRNMVSLARQGRNRAVLAGIPAITTYS
jgi:hypothetical protein